jgi:hypothetical protein
LTSLSCARGVQDRYDADEGGDDKRWGPGRAAAAEHPYLRARQADLLLASRRACPGVAVAGSACRREASWPACARMVPGRRQQEAADSSGVTPAQRGEHGGVAVGRGIADGGVDGFEAKAEVAWICTRG